MDGFDCSKTWDACLKITDGQALIMILDLTSGGELAQAATNSEGAQGFTTQINSGWNHQ